MQHLRKATGRRLFADIISIKLNYSAQLLSIFGALFGFHTHFSGLTVLPQLEDPGLIFEGDDFSGKK
jgi:hypothetical protein